MDALRLAVMATVGDYQQFVRPPPQEKPPVQEEEQEMVQSVKKWRRPQPALRKYGVPFFRTEAAMLDDHTSEIVLSPGERDFHEAVSEFIRECKETVKGVERLMGSVRYLLPVSLRVMIVLLCRDIFDLDADLCLMQGRFRIYTQAGKAEEETDDDADGAEELERVIVTDPKYKQQVENITTGLLDAFGAAHSALDVFKPYRRLYVENRDTSTLHCFPSCSYQRTLIVVGACV